MRAMVLHEQQAIEECPLVLEEMKTPSPRAGEVRIKIHACGICHTDLHEVEGDIDVPHLPRIPGHQIVGVIDDLGEGVSDWSPGTRVGVPWLYSTCQNCKFCKSGLENLCTNARFTGKDLDGGYAEYMVAPEDFIYALPRDFPDLQAAPLLCAGIIGYRALRLSDIKPGQNLGIIGFGASAHVTIQVANYWDCRVYVFSRSPKHRRFAEDLGAVWAGEIDEDPEVQMDAVLNFTPAGETILDGQRMLERGGTQICAGIHMSEIPAMPYHLIYGERTLKSVANSTRKDARNLLELAAEIPIQTNVEMYSLEKANEALQLLKRSEIQGAAVLQIQ